MHAKDSDLQARHAAIDADKYSRSVKSTATEPLWCTMAEEWNHRLRVFEIKFSYTHAPDAAAAKAKYLFSNSWGDGSPRIPTRNVITALAVGFLATDDNGDKCVADSTSRRQELAVT